MRGLRWSLRVVAVVLILIGLFVLWKDVPSNHELSISSQQQFNQAVWVGVNPALAFEHVYFMTDPDLFVYPTDTGWSGSFSFAVANQQFVGSTIGSFVLLLPKGATIGPRCFCRGVTVSSNGIGSLEAVTLTFDASKLLNYVVHLPLSWSYQQGLQQKLGIGQTRYTILVSNTYVYHNSLNVVAPFFSDVGRQPDGQATPTTDTLELDIRTSHGADEINSPSPVPNGSLATTYEVGYLLSADSPDAVPDSHYQTLSFTIENPRWQLFTQIDASILFLALGFGLSEMARRVNRREPEVHASSGDVISKDASSSA
jgi:hypothetical protein